MKIKEGQSALEQNLYRSFLRNILRGIYEIRKYYRGMFYRPP